MVEYIDKEKAIKAVDNHTFDTADGLCLDTDITIVFEELPTADVVPVVHAKWIRTNVNGMHKIKCENCDYMEPEYRTYIRDYCPCCGARMDGE